MKKTLKMSVVVLCTIVSLFAVNFNTAFAGIEIVYFGGAHLPNDANSPSWTAASNNRMQQIRNQLAGNGNPVGTGKEMAMVTALDYTKMVAPNTSPEVWNGLLATGTGEHGNRYHVAFGIFANDGSTFVPSSVSLNMQAYVWDSVIGYVAYGTSTNTTLTTVNNFRQRMSPGIDGINGTADDTVATIQSGTVATTGFIFGGQGKGYSPFGTGTDQDKINNTIAWMQANKLAIKYTCTVGSVSVVKWVYGNDKSHPQPTITGTTAFNWKSIGEPVKFQKSSNLVDWTSDGNWVWKREGTMNVFPLADHPGAPRQFYRLARQ